MADMVADMVMDHERLERRENGLGVARLVVSDDGPGIAVDQRLAASPEPRWYSKFPCAPGRNLQGM